MIDQAQRLRQLARAMPPNGKSSGTAGQDEQKQHPEKSVQRPVCHTVAVTSGKGGVGKTNIALTLSIALSNLGKRVLLLDADLGLANVHILLGLAPSHNIGDVTSGQCSVDQVICPGPAGVHIIPGASGLEVLANIETLKLEQLRRSLSVLESRYDFLIVDTGAGIGRVTTEFSANADSVLVVMTTDPTSLADAYAMIKVLSEKKDRTLSVLVNMAGSDKEARDAFDRLNTLVVRFLGRPAVFAGAVLYDPEVARMVKRQKVAILERPSSVFSQRLSMLARKYCGMQTGSRRPGSGFFSRIFNAVRG